MMQNVPMHMAMVREYSLIWIEIKVLEGLPSDDAL